MTELKESQIANSSKIIEDYKRFVERCMRYDNPNHKRGECDSYKIAIKDSIVYFKEKKRDRAIHEEDVVELGSKERSPSNKEAYERQKLMKIPSSSHPGDISIPKEWQ
uniref:Predicted protein n=1 Tax=Physcomitrium patens TaxID=3218 RepID=A9U1B0_PHYPA